MQWIDVQKIPLYFSHTQKTVNSILLFFFCSFCLLAKIDYFRKSNHGIHFILYKRSFISISSCLLLYFQRIQMCFTFTPYSFLVWLFPLQWPTTCLNLIYNFIITLVHFIFFKKNRFKYYFLYYNLNNYFFASGLCVVLILELLFFFVLVFFLLLFLLN